MFVEHAATDVPLPVIRHCMFGFLGAGMDRTDLNAMMLRSVALLCRTLVSMIGNKILHICG
jgi:hypothetical protein